MTNMQTSLPLLIVWPSILNPVINFSTHLWLVKWNALGYTFALCTPFHLLHHWCNTCTNHITNDMIHFISSCVILVHRSWLHLLFTVAFIHRRQVLLKLYRHVVHRSKASNLPFTPTADPSSQVMFWSSPPWSHDSMSCLMCNELLHHHMCELCNISKPFSPSWHMLLTHMYLWTNYLCISHKHN